jgi:hypothetical protein
MDSLEKRLVLNAYEGSDEPTNHQRMVIGIGTKIALLERKKRENQVKSQHVQSVLEAVTLQLRKLSQQYAALRVHLNELQREDLVLQKSLTELYDSSCKYGIKQEAIDLKNSAKFICECNKINGIHFEDDHEPTSVVDISE